MKPATPSFVRCLVAILTGGTLGFSQDVSPIIPVGSLSAFPTIVQTGTHPQLTWDVTLPEAVNDIVDIVPPGTVVPKRCLMMNVRVLGASVMRVWTNSWGHVTNWEWVPTEARINYNGGGYNRIFFDTHDNVNPNEILHSQSVQANSAINFGGRYRNSNGSWSDWFSSTNSNTNVVALVNGDTPPTTTPMYQQPSIESFILPYLDENGNIKLGSRDVIYLMELTHTNKNDSGFDLQDLVLLVTFYDEVTNEQGQVVDCNGNVVNPNPGNNNPSNGNGGGNNKSGLGDGTNPGQGSGTANSPNQGTDNPNNSGNGSSSGNGNNGNSNGKANSSGNGNNKSGLGDGTNPGKGSGTANSPNQGTNNPNKAGNRSR